MTSQAMLDALHAELLLDVHALVVQVESLKTDFPAIAAQVRGSADAVAAASAATLTDFQSMGHGLMSAMREQAQTERVAGLEASRAATQNTRVALAQFSKQFWLLGALAAVNTTLLIALLAVR